MKKILLVALAAITLASCAKNEVVELNEGNAISFRAWTGNAGRLVPTTSESIKTRGGFDVWAYTSPTVGDPLAYMTSIDVTWQTDKWDYAPHKFWPADPLDFYAVSPLHDGAKINVSATATKVQVVDFVQELAAGSQTDLLYAVKQDQERKYAAVQMEFDHALAQISFQAKNTNIADQGIEVKIEGIKVVNVNSKGTFTLPLTTDTSASDKAATAAQGAWDPTSVPATFEAGVVSPAVALGTEAVEITDKAAGGRLLLLPQTTTAWAPANFNVADPDAVVAIPVDDNSYFLVNCTVKDKTSNLYLWGQNASTGGAKELAIPFAANWEPGLHYIYTFIFGEGAGYDPTTGEEVLVPIKFTVAVDDFQEAAPDAETPGTPDFEPVL